MKVGESIAPDQTTFGVDFTEITCGKTTEEECALAPTFTFQAEKITSRIYKVKGIDHGRPAWHIVLLIDDLETIRIFKEEVEQGHVDVDYFGKALKSGWGRDPPQEVEDWLDRVCKGLETLIY